MRGMPSPLSFTVCLLQVGSRKGAAPSYSFAGVGGNSLGLGTPRRVAIHRVALGIPSHGGHHCGVMDPTGVLRLAGVVLTCIRPAQDSALGASCAAARMARMARIQKIIGIT